jgi:peptidase E
MKTLYFLTSSGGCANHIASMFRIKKHSHIFLADNKENLAERKYEFETAFSLPATICSFNNQNNITQSYIDILHSDVVVVHGGDLRMLLRNLKKYNLLKYIKKVPIYVGISAGAMVVTKFVNVIRDNIEFFKTTQNSEYLGWIDHLKIDCHFNILQNNQIYMENLKKILKNQNHESFLFLTDGSYVMIHKEPEIDVRRYCGIIYKHEKGQWYRHTDRFRKISNN